ncbi:MAG: coproporphyrinogen dehydrogenase HemZ [Clostridiales bacterium]|nr:coproporphyrinogen dehydrogenase HemZ [Clostridiales bacterium]
MELYLTGHQYRYAVEQIMMVLFPGQKPVYPDEGSFASGGDACQSSLRVEGDAAAAETRLRLEGQETSGEATVTVPAGASQLERDRLLQRAVKQSFYRAALPILGEAPPWGALTGIRPAKLASRALESGLTEQQTREQFYHEYFVSESRTELALEAAKAGLRAKNSLRHDELSLYVGIPFCPTRCAYCSFVSADVKQALRLVEPFLEALHREIDAVAVLLDEAGLHVRTIYMGGGTPTTLSAEQMDRLLAHLRGAFGLSRLTEFTVEAGRPDTITAEKMAVLRKHGVGRVSVNPQTMENHVLRAMGRAHTAEDILRAYQTVREAGLLSVNMDLIAGLPQDTPEGFRGTLEQVIDLDPENITVHTLALKKGSRLKMEQQGLPTGEETRAMLDYAWPRLWQAGYAPYYLYRQKYMTGALENIGWCKPGEEGLYNICIMEELHTIVALGAGGSTKLTDPATGKIVRLTNPKYPREYIDRIDAICRDKRALVEFHRGLSVNK